MDPGDDICRSARACRDLFDACVANLDLKDYASSIRSAQGDFNLWCSTVRATSTGKSSLNYRLRNHHDLWEAICDLLAGLAASLRKCEQRVAIPAQLETTDASGNPSEVLESLSSTGSPVSWDAISNEGDDPDSLQMEDTLSTDPVVAEHLSYVRAILDQLTRISLAIRKAGTKYLFEEADAALDDDKFKDFRSHLTRIILRAYPDPEAELLRSEEKMHRASDYARLTSVQKRLVHADILRKHRIEFITESRSSKKRPKTDEIEQPDEPPRLVDAVIATTPSVTESSKAPGPTPSISISRRPPEVAPRKPAALSAVSTTAPIATDAGSQLDIKPFLSEKAFSKATKLTRIGATQPYPRSPKLEPDGSLICPYCDDVLPSSYAKNDLSWKAHVAQDILPYSCFIDKCDTPYEMYLSDESLLAHMVDKHSSMRWTCDYCASKDKASKQRSPDTPHEFSSAGEWEDHMGRAHSDRVTAHQRPILAELNKRPMMGPLTCPLCDFAMETMDSKIDDHILRHLHEFALWALPESPGAMSDEKSKASQVSGTLSHTKAASGEVEPPLEYLATDHIQFRKIVEGLLLLAPDFSPTVSRLLSRLEWLDFNCCLNEATTELWGSHLGRIRDILETHYQYRYEKDTDITKEIIQSLVTETSNDLLGIIEVPLLGPPNGLLRQADAAFYANLPQRNPKFTSRDEILVELDNKLFLESNSQSKQQSRVVLTGESGIGKTAVAVELAYRTREERQNCSIFWVNAEDKDRIEESYLRTWEAVGSPLGPTNDRIHSLLYYLTWTFNGEWLMILDGLRPESLLYMRFMGLLPGGLKGSLLVTAPDVSCLSLLGPAKKVQVPRLMIDLYITSRTEALWIVPFQRNPQFVGRTSEIAQVDAMLSSETCCGRVAIVGLGGVGKTQIALEFAYQLRERQPNCSVFWIPVTNVESMLEAYLEIGQQMQIPNIEKEQADVQKLVQRQLSQECSGKWLLVFNNVDHTNIWTDKADNTTGLNHQIDYLPKSKHGSILFTTRSQKAAMELAGKNVVSVGEMDDTTAKELLQKSLTNRDLLADDQATTELLQNLTHLPLAIIQAAAYINENQITLSQYAALIVNIEQNMIDVLSEEFEDEGRYKDIKNPTATTWLISFQRIRARDPLAAEYLSFMSCVNAKDIPQSLLPLAQSMKRAVDAIGTLSAYSFIIKHKTDQLLDLHQLVHLATRNWLRTENSLGQWAAKALERLEEVFPDSDYANRSAWRIYLPHAHYALESELGEGVGNKKTELLWKFGLCVSSKGRYKEAEKAFMQVMETHKRVLGKEHPDTLACMANLASTYRNQGRWKEAEELEVQVMETSSRVLGAEHPSTLAGMGNLALMYRNQGRWTEAEELEVQVMETSSRVLGVEHPSTLASMGNLASTYRNQGRWKEAEELEVQIIETRKGWLGAEHPDTLVSIANLASTFWNQGRWKEAEELEVQVMETKKSVLGEEHPDTLTSIANLASTYRNQGRWKEAEELEVQVVETSKRVLGEEHLDTLTSIANLASTFWNQGRWKEAEDLEVQVMETRKRVLGEEHPYTLTSIANLASTYRNQGRWKEAEELEMQVMEMRKRVLGKEHPDTLASIANLASTYRNQGRWKEAEELEVQVMEMRKRVLGEEHPDTLTSMANLASTFWNQGQWKEAEDLEVQVMETRKRVLGEEHPDTLTSMANLASTFWNQGRWKKAEELEVQVMGTRKRMLGEEHPDMLTSMANLALTYRDQGRWKEAEELGVQVMKTRTRVLGEKHPDTLTSINNLAFILKERGQNAEAIKLMEKCIQLRTLALGAKHPYTLSSFIALIGWQTED